MDQNTARSLARRIAQRATKLGITTDASNPDVATLVIDCIDAGVDPQAVLAH
jgi:hypothetical protein